MLILTRRVGESLMIGDEVTVPTASNSASTFDSATVVRVVNSTSSSETLTMINDDAESVSITIMANSVEFIEKKPTYSIWCSASLKGAKVGFTN